MSLVVVPFGLIGDTLGTLPLIAEVARKDAAAHRKWPTFVACHREARPVIDLLPRELGIRYIDDAADGFIPGKTHVLNLPEAFHYAERHPCYMTQAYYFTIGWPVPLAPARPPVVPTLDVPRRYGTDFGLAPFARSLPPHQRWPRERWQELVDRLSGHTFTLYGSAERGDDPAFVVGSNVFRMFDAPLGHVAGHLKALRHGLISVSTGPSHLAYAVDCKNFLIINQGPFAKNPEAFAIDSPIPNLTVDRVMAYLEMHCGI